MSANDRVKRRKVALMEIDIDKSGYCWEWTGRRNKSGYGLSARLNEMLNEFGLLVAKPKRKDRLINITIRPVGLPVKQGELFQ